MSSSPVVGSTKTGSPDVGGAAKSSTTSPGAGDATVEATPDKGCPAELPTPMAGAISSNDAVGAGEDVDPTRSNPAIAAKAANSSAAAPGDKARRAMMQREAKGAGGSQNGRAGTAARPDRLSLFLRTQVCYTASTPTSTILR